MKVLVTGGSGYLGSHVCGYFNAIDYSKRNGLDLLDEKSLRRSLSDIDVVVHLAGATKGSNEELFKNNIMGTYNLLSVISSMKNKPAFLFSSSKEVYGNNPDKLDFVSEECLTDINGDNFYGLTKLLAEQLITSYALKYEFRVGIFRMSTVYAPYTKGTNPGLVSRFLDMVINGKEIVLKSEGRQVRDPLFITDLTDLFDKFIHSDVNFGIYNAGGGKENAISLIGLVHILEDTCGKKANLKLSKEDSGDQMRYVSDLSKLEKELNWRPTVSLKEGILCLFKT